MFGLFDAAESIVSNVLDTAESLVHGEMPSKRQVSKLISDGVSIYAISSATGIAVEILEGLSDE
jgi:hypothetical protein